MTKLVQKMVTETSFDALGVLVPAGHIGTFDKERLTGKEPHIHDVPDTPTVFVEQAAIGPSGPNPTDPQQLPPDGVQGPGGGYFRPGVKLVGEVTRDADQRLADRLKEGDTSEGDLMDKLRKAEEETARLRAVIAAKQAGTPAPAASTQNNDDALVAGNVGEIVAKLGETDDAGLEALRVAEMDREKPRKGVIDAIKAEQAKRTA